MTTTTGRRTRQAVNNDWQTQGACRPHSPELFFPVGQNALAQAQERRAKAVCHACPVRQACLDWALTTGQDAGVWGGLSQADRRELLAQRTGLTGEDPAQVAVAEELVALYGTRMLAWKDEGLDIKVIDRKLRGCGADWRHEGLSRVAIRLAYRQMGVTLAGGPSTGVPAQDRVFAEWDMVQDMLGRGVNQKEIASRVGVGVDSFRLALKAVAGGSVDPAAMRETSLVVAA
jgi:WhiB family redox-sensing transcriptional regulator